MSWRNSICGQSNLKRRHSAQFCSPYAYMVIKHTWGSVLKWWMRQKSVVSSWRRHIYTAHFIQYSVFVIRVDYFLHYIIFDIIPTSFPNIYFIHLKGTETPELCICVKHNCSFFGFFLKGRRTLYRIYWTFSVTQTSWHKIFTINVSYTCIRTQV